jgi:hypothetical protein
MESRPQCESGPTEQVYGYPCALAANGLKAIRANVASANLKLVLMLLLVDKLKGFSAKFNANQKYSV